MQWLITLVVSCASRSSASRRTRAFPRRRCGLDGVGVSEAVASDMQGLCSFRRLQVFPKLKVRKMASLPHPDLHAVQGGQLKPTSSDRDATFETTMAQHDSQFGYDDHFTPARSRKKRKNRPPTEPPSPSVLLDKVSEELAPTDWLRDTMCPYPQSSDPVASSS